MQPIRDTDDNAMQACGGFKAYWKMLTMGCARKWRNRRLGITEPLLLAVRRAGVSKYPSRAQTVKGR